MNNKLIFTLFLILPLLISCKKQQVRTLDKLSKNELRFENFTAKSKVSYIDKNQRITLNVSIRIRHDSVIWISASIPPGFEVARMMITTDSVFILDKFNKNYYATDFSFLSKKLSALSGFALGENPGGLGISYDLLQDLILGNMPFYKSSGQNKLIKEADHYLVRQKYDRYIIDNYINKKNRKLEKLKVHIEDSGFSESLHNNIIELEYKDFKKLRKYDFAYSNTLKLFYEHNKSVYNLTLELKYKKVNITEKHLNFPFKVSSKYKKIIK